MRGSCLEVLGSSGQYRMGFSPDLVLSELPWHYLLRAVTILFLGIVAAAFLIGALLQKGASDLDLETTTITRDFSRIIQALNPS